MTAAYLAVLDGQDGAPMFQVVYPLDGRAVGHPANWAPSEKLELPDRDKPWSIADAVAAVTRMQ